MLTGRVTPQNNHFFDNNVDSLQRLTRIARNNMSVSVKTPRVPNLTNVIGDRGEKIFELAITNFQETQKPLFKPGFLGEKWPTVDYYVELLGVKNSTPFFFTQIKSTMTEIGSGDTSLRIQATPNKCTKLFSIPGPTYLVGVHEPTRKAFILSVHNKPVKGIYSIPLKYELTTDNLKILHEEVIAFWKKSPNKPTGSYFI